MKLKQYAKTAAITLALVGLPTFLSTAYANTRDQLIRPILAAQHDDSARGQSDLENALKPLLCKQNITTTVGLATNFIVDKHDLDPFVRIRYGNMGYFQRDCN